MPYENTPTNQPPQRCTIPPTQWPEMIISYQQLKNYHLSKRCCKCVALRRLKLGVLQFINAPVSQN